MPTIRLHIAVNHTCLSVSCVPVHTLRKGPAVHSFCTMTAIGHHVACAQPISQLGGASVVKSADVAAVHACCMPVNLAALQWWALTQSTQSNTLWAGV